MSCLRSTTISILVNVIPTNEFNPSKGLKQEDPLTPFLFVIIIEGLTTIVRQAKVKNILNGIKLRKIGFQFLLCNSHMIPIFVRKM